MFISRKYLREKYSKVKNDMESFLDVLNLDLDDKISKEDAREAYATIKDASEAILKELEKSLF